MGCEKKPMAGVLDPEDEQLPAVHGEADKGAHWFGSRWLRLVITVTAPLLACVLVSLSLGLWLNVKYFGSSTGGHSTSTTSPHVNVLAIYLASGGIAFALSLVRYAVKRFGHPRAWGVYSVLAYLALALVVVVPELDGTKNPLYKAASSDVVRQLSNLLAEGNFNYADEKFPYTWNNIVELADFYNWLRGPLYKLMYATARNSADLSSTVNAPAQYNSNVNYTDYTDSTTPTRAVWVISAVRIRQVRTQLEPTYQPGLLPGAILNKVPEFTQDKIDSTVRDFSSYGYTEDYTSNQYTNDYAQVLESPDIVLSHNGRSRSYPGLAGHTLSLGTCSSDVYLESICQGTWTPFFWPPNATAGGQALDDVNFMQNSRWIDDQTAMVQTVVDIWNPNNGIRVQMFFWLETLNSGRVVPNAPQSAVKHWIPEAVSSVDWVAVFALYYLCEEVQDLVLQGPKQYLCTNRWVHVMDITAIASTMAMSVWYYISTGMLVALQDPALYPFRAAAASLQTSTSLALFFIIFKSLKFTRNIPVMCLAGNVFAHVITDIALFLVVMLVLMTAFGALFYSILVLNTVDFESFPKALFALFRGLQGDMDVDALVAASPLYGPLIYSAYITAVLFMAFTLLIGMISSAHDAVKNNVCEDGLIQMLLQKANGGAAAVEGAPDVLETLRRMEERMDVLAQSTRQLTKELRRLRGEDVDPPSPSLGLERKDDCDGEEEPVMHMQNLQAIVV